MKLLFLFFLGACTGVVLAQAPSQWERVYTFDESFIDINTQIVTLIEQDVARVRFRWTFDQPEELSGRAGTKYKSRIEVVELNCKKKVYRPYHISFFDQSDELILAQLIEPPRHWRRFNHGLVMPNLLGPTCALVEEKTRPRVVSKEAIEHEKVKNLVIDFLEQLETTKDFNVLIQKFFAPNYLARYLRDQKYNWFANLERDTALKATRADLQRFYVALMNSAYLTSLYFMTEYRHVSNGLISEEQLIPPDVSDFIDTHPYSKTYRGKHENYDYLADSIDSVERMRSYTDLLEGVADLIRKRLAIMKGSPRYQLVDTTRGETEIRMETCPRECLGLPPGTRLFQVKRPLLRLQVAEVAGEWRVVSATVE